MYKLELKIKLIKNEKLKYNFPTYTHNFKPTN